MFSTASPQNILCQADNTLVRKILICLSGIFFLALAAHISIPLQPVPLTFQSAAVVMLGMALGSRLAGWTVSGYLVAGLSGLPVFAHGTPMLMTSGYLAGFLPAAMLSGWLAEKGLARNMLTAFITACAGTIVIFACGLSVLTTLTSWKIAMATGLMPFVLTEPLKLLAVSLVIPRCWKSE